MDQDQTLHAWLIGEGYFPRVAGKRLQRWGDGAVADTRHTVLLLRKAGVNIRRPAVGWIDWWLTFAETRAPEKTRRLTWPQAVKRAGLAATAANIVQAREFSEGPAHPQAQRLTGLWRSEQMERLIGPLSEEEWQSKLRVALRDLTVSERTAIKDFSKGNRRLREVVFARMTQQTAPAGAERPL